MTKIIPSYTNHIFIQIIHRSYENCQDLRLQTCNSDFFPRIWGLALICFTSRFYQLNNCILVFNFYYTFRVIIPPSHGISWQNSSWEITQVGELFKCSTVNPEAGRTPFTANCIHFKFPELSLKILTMKVFMKL